MDVEQPAILRFNELVVPFLVPVYIDVSPAVDMSSWRRSHVPALPQEVIIIDSSSDEEEEEEVGLYIYYDNDVMLVDAIVQGPGGTEIDFIDVNVEEATVPQEMVKKPSLGLTVMEIGQALTTDLYDEIEGDPKECTICLESYYHGEDIANLRCNHVFHPMCISQWLGRMNRCPNCNVSALNFTH